METRFDGGFNPITKTCGRARVGPSTIQMAALPSHMYHCSHQKRCRHGFIQHLSACSHSQSQHPSLVPLLRTVGSEPLDTANYGQRPMDGRFASQDEELAATSIANDWKAPFFTWFFLIFPSVSELSMDLDSPTKMIPPIWVATFSMNEESPEFLTSCPCMSTSLFMS